MNAGTVIVRTLTRSIVGLGATALFLGLATPAHADIPVIRAELSGSSTSRITPVPAIDPVAGEISAIVINDRNKYAPQCPPLKQNGKLFRVAEHAARSEAPVNPPNMTNYYRGRTLQFIGKGDPRPAAVTDAYKRGAGPALSRCDYTEFGVAFMRVTTSKFLGADYDVVAIVFGTSEAPAPVAAPPPPATPVTLPPVVTRRPAPVRPTATVTADVDLYKAPGGNANDKLNKFLKQGTKVTVKKPCTPHDWCALADGTFAYGEFLQNN